MVIWFYRVVMQCGRRSRCIGLLTLMVLATSTQAQRLEATFGVLPIVGSQTYVGDQLGLTGFWQSAPLADAYVAEVRFLSSVNDHQRLTLSGRMPGTVVGKRDYFEGSLYLSQFANEFFGYQAADVPAGERYDDETVELSLGWSYPLSPQWRAGVEGVAVWAEIDFADAASPLRTDDVRWTEGGRALALDLSLARDTRNQPYWPSRGTYGRSVLRLGLDDTGALFFRQVSSVAVYTLLPADVVLALAVQMQSASANTPFIYMPTLARDDWMRGVTTGRYRHRSSFATQVEARLPLNPRVAAAVFVQGGQMAAQPRSWWDEHWVQGGGVGLRYAVSDQRRQNIRLDMGWVNGQPGMVVNFGEAF
ncbi:MAG: BamA/TamA family outer membrane protein [Natronospirillum sp.]